MTELLRPLGEAGFGEIVVSLFLVLGGFFALVGSFGLVKLDNPMSRLHAPTKASTLGVGGLLAASILNAYFIRGEGSLHELLIMGFLFVTTPVSAHFIAKANIHHRRGIETLPKPADDPTWAVLDARDTIRAVPPVPTDSMDPDHRPERTGGHDA